MPWSWCECSEGVFDVSVGSGFVKPGTDIMMNSFCSYRLNKMVLNTNQQLFEIYDQL